MKLERLTVGTLLEMAKGGSESVEVPAETLAELCKAWLALDAAPEVDLGGQYLEAWDVFAQVPEFADGSGFIESDHPLANERVRLVG